MNLNLDLIISMGLDSYIGLFNISGWYFASAKDNINIEESARFLVQKIIENDKWSAHGARMKEKGSNGTLRLHNGNNKSSETSLDPPKGRCSC